MTIVTFSYSSDRVKSQTTAPPLADFRTGAEPRLLLLQKLCVDRVLLAALSEEVL
jgi:hypothetical protein